MASEPAEPTTRPQDDVIERARQLIDDEVMTRTGRSVGDLASGHVARALAEAGLLADPAQATELEELRADNERLRARIHEAVDETQRRYAKYQKAEDDHRNTVAFAKEWFAREGTDFGFSSAAGRAIVIDLIEQRDALSLLLRGMARKLVAARAELEEWRAELEEWRAAGADGGPEWPLARVRDALGTPRGRAVSVHAAEVIAERDQAVDAVAHAVRLLREAGVNRGNGMPARVSTLIGERDALEKILSKERCKVDAALALHTESKLYTECGHDHTDDDSDDLLYVDEIGTVCEDGYLVTICRACCCTANGDQSEECANHHDGPCWPCPTRAALVAIPPAEEPVRDVAMTHHVHEHGGGVCYGPGGTCTAERAHISGCPRLSGVALRDVEEADDAAGDLP